MSRSILCRSAEILLSRAVVSLQRALHIFAWKRRARAFRQRPTLPAVLLYHSVSDRARDPLLLAISPQRFESHLFWLTQNTTPLGLSDFVAKLKRGTLPSNAVCVTFDDGYADNFETAAPLLERYQIPATVFIASEGIDRGTEPWWEELDSVLLESASLPSVFEWNNHRFEIEPNIDSSRSTWTVLAAPQTQREKLFINLSEIAKKLSAEKRNDLRDSLQRWAGQPRIRPERRLASWDCLRAVEARGLITIGAHTHSHPGLGYLNASEQLREIELGAQRLNQELGVRNRAFAYPFGTWQDFTPITIKSVKAAGFSTAVANMTGHLTKRSHSLELPRVLVGNWEKEELAARLGV